MHRIRKVEVCGEHRLRVRFDDGSVRVADFTALVRGGGVWAGLAEAERFAAVRIGAGGRCLEWAEGPDACADALWMDSTPEASDSAIPAVKR